jgi:hypothetical protein
MKISIRVAATCLAALLALAPRPSAAMGSCSGVISATLLSPLPAPLVVGLELMDNSPRNIDLANRFKAGLKQAGITTDGAPTVQMSMNVTVMSQAPNNAAPVPLQDDNWMNGGLAPSLPDQSRVGGNRQSPGPTTLLMRAEIRRTPADRVAWVGVLQCTENGDDQLARAYDLGKVIGAAIGLRVDQKRF